MPNVAPANSVSSKRTVLIVVAIALSAGAAFFTLRGGATSEPAIDPKVAAKAAQIEADLKAISPPVRAAEQPLPRPPSSGGAAASPEPRSLRGGGPK